MKFSNTYINLGQAFFQRCLPQKFPVPELLLWNKSLANDLSISEELQSNKELLSQYFSGNKLPKGAEAIALAYSGHQFGHFNPQLGDGRAHLIGEIIDKKNIHRDIQLKGSGQTKFSRRGDGKCALAPALREYIMSEALYALGVPTSRCLSVVTTGEVIHRGLAKAGAVVTRVAESHIRVGTFQYFAARGDISSLKSLVDYSIKRHFPEIEKNKTETEKPLSPEERILSFLSCAIDKQITLIIEWLRIGFIHGVMNTDNTAICGETIDFGPCAMLGVYDESRVFSSIDEYGRYAFGNQGKIAHWNMARLADCLMPLLIDIADENLTKNEKEQQALNKVEQLIHQYSQKFDKAYFTMYGEKLGISNGHVNKSLINDLLTVMKTQNLDYTDTFLQLTKSLTNEKVAQEMKSSLGDWHQQWLEVLAQENAEHSDSQRNTQQHYSLALSLMEKSNPVVIPRNHHVEAILEFCETSIGHDPSVINDSTREIINNKVNEFIEVLQSPYKEISATSKYQETSEDSDKYYQTFCGT